MTQQRAGSGPGAKDEYVLGYREEIVQKIAQRSVGREGAFILPYLRRGMSLLDAGCGPGSITLGLAGLLAPGRVVGFDVDTGQVEKAQRLAQRMGLRNIELRTADIHALPFEDGSFDAVFCHTLFRHLSRPEEALRELYRVCKPGGVIGVRDGLGMFDHLSTARLGDAMVPFSELMATIPGIGPGLPDIGVRLKGLIRRAGFERLKISTFNEVYHEPEDLQMLESWFRSILEGDLGRRAVEAGKLTRESLDDLLAKMRNWPSDPDAISVVSWIEYVAWKPEENPPSKEPSPL